LIQEFGDVGGEKTVTFDMEPAAHNMLKRHFPEWHVRSCYFHYFKNVRDQAKKKKLHDAFKDDEFLNWFNALMGNLLKNGFNSTFRLCLLGSAECAHCLPALA
jgi:hypothetical protein